MVIHRFDRKLPIGISRLTKYELADYRPRMELDPLLDEIEAFLRESEVTPTAFGRDAMGDPRFVFDLRAGRELRRATAQQARLQISRYRTTGEFGRLNRSAA